MSEAAERTMAAQSALDVIERVMPKLGEMPPEDADEWARAIASEHFADAPDKGYGVYGSLVGYARVARER